MISSFATAHLYLQPHKMAQCCSFCCQRQDRFSLSRLWKPLTHSLKQRKKNVPSKDKTLTSSSDGTLPPVSMKTGLISHFNSHSILTFPFPPCDKNNNVALKRAIFPHNFIYFLCPENLFTIPTGMDQASSLLLHSCN